MAEKRNSREEPNKDSNPLSMGSICISSCIPPTIRNCRMKHTPKDKKTTPTSFYKELTLLKHINPTKGDTPATTYSNSLTYTLLLRETPKIAARGQCSPSWRAAVLQRNISAASPLLLGGGYLRPGGYIGRPADCLGLVIAIRDNTSQLELYPGLLLRLFLI